ncbi:MULTISPECIES: c-type cytochrome [Myroides]|uniref:Photosynthetic reaction center cytochrome c subunit n=1 Tax=Myroides albus TaxID=2562892 RepID=A0A6I3LAX9_9FLAO|nr:MULTISPECIES: c-type cytochrome [Myroides]MTG96589.1 c-type cytochrome [Myroides albus]MVX34585.1 c-type cytochrome [Myroides sp. LoEW2-1]UVD80998.1 c-type cytochrome [Myroides albus]
MKIKNLLGLGLVIVGATILLAFNNKTTITESTKEQSEWKNLKVLPADISNDSLKGLMKGYNEALGVKCSYCHAQIEGSDKLDFADDSKKEKEFTRHMIVMTRKINAENFNWQNAAEPEKIDVVSCAMCHRGSPQPSKDLKK